MLLVFNLVVITESIVLEDFSNHDSRMFTLSKLRQPLDLKIYYSILCETEPCYSRQYNGT